jgi:hypothetical protein
MPGSVPANNLPFVDLKRSFKEWRPDPNPGDPAISDSAGPSGSPQVFAWDSLLARKRVIILAEMGSGKTRELQETASRLQQNGETAFFVRLDKLIASPLSNVLGPTNHRLFQQWIESNATASFFLDSVDEAKLTRPLDFHTAIAGFSAALGVAGRERAKIYVTSRFTGWNHSRDHPEIRAQLCDSVLPKQKITTDNQSIPVVSDEVLIVKLEPFDRSQAQAFATAIGTSSADEFIGEVDRNFAWEFARRPLDVIDLAGFWNEHRRLGTLTEIVRNHVQRNLRERPDRPAATIALTEAQANEGARTLAAASILCRNTEFKISAEDGAGLNAADCLPATWGSAQIAELLARPIFDEASYGRRQFHHRRAVEFLAAQWLADRMDEGCPLHGLRSIFFEENGGSVKLRPSLDAVAAWLCGYNTPWAAELRNWINATRPEIHLRYGDPEVLSEGDRRHIINRIAAIYDRRQHAWLETDESTLRRLAKPDLTPDIARIIADPHAVRELRWQLLNVALVASLTGCVDAALLLFSDPTENDSLRTAAASLIIGIGTLEQKERLLAALRLLPVLSDTLGYSLLHELYPALLSPADLVQLSERVLGDEMAIFPGMLRRRLTDALVPNTASDLLRRLLELIQRPPFQIDEPDGIRVSLSYGRFRDALTPLVQVLLARDQLDAAETENVAASLILLGGVRGDLESNTTNALATGSLKHLAVRRAYFLRCIAITIAITHQLPTRWFFIVFGRDTVLRPALVDLQWLAAEIKAGTDPAHRSMLLALAMSLWVDERGSTSQLRPIQAAATGDVQLQQELKALRRTAREAPFRRWWYQQFVTRFHEPWWWQQKKHQWKKRFERWNLIRILHWELRGIATGREISLLSWLTREADAENRSSWTAQDWKGVTRKYGPLVSWAARRGCKVAWRHYVPLPPSAKPNANQTAHHVMVGLNGIQVQFAAGMDFASLSVTDARTATLYAVNELNSPPRWLDILAASQPAAVGAALVECIASEWTLPAEDARIYGVLARVLGNADVLAPLVRDSVLRLVQQGDPVSSTLLDFALRTLAPTYRPEIASLAAERIPALPLSSPSMHIWAAAWLRTNPPAALTWLEAFSEADQAANQLILLTCANLHGRGPSGPTYDRETAYTQPVNLRRLILIVYCHIRPADDLRRHGTYTPGARDYAQEFRSGLITLLDSQPGGDTAQILTLLAEEPLLAALRDFILYRRDVHLRQGAETAGWPAVRLRDFAAELEGQPRDDQELYGVVRNRLNDIKHMVELSDFSIRNGVRPTDDERVLRHLIATELNRTARNRYSPTQESEIDEAKRPDIRVAHPAFAGPISIEVKWAENWPVHKLLERLENQLIGTYLRPTESHFGIFFLGFIDRHQDPTWANPSGGARIHFQEVVQIVRAKAVELKASRPDIRGLEVVAVDFRPPSAWEV